MQNELEKGILKYVDSSIENAPYTQIYTGLIKASGVDGYTIDLNGVEYTNVPSEGSFSTNDTVKVVIPNNQPSNMFILAESTGGGGTGAVSSVNGMTGDVVISNVSSADKLSSAKTITLSGDATGSVSTDFSTNPTISVTVVDDSHNHIISNVDGLQTELDGKSNIGHYHATDRDRANHTGTQLASTISDFASTVRSTVLTGLSTATNAIISATDTVLSALGKLQAQITANLSTLTTHIGNTTNPHSVTKTQVGLGNVNNTSDIDKDVRSSVRLRNLFTTRPTSANLPIVGDGSLKEFKATRPMTDGKPPQDAHILHFEWDNTSGHNSQLAIGNNDGNLYFRGMAGGVWQPWYMVYSQYRKQPDVAKLTTARTINLTGDVTGSVSTDFSTSPTISVTVVDDSHNHIISNVDGLQTELDGKSNIGHYHATDRSRANHTGTQLASTISDFASTVRSTVLTGLSTATNAIISATDTVLSALGKLQAQITANLSTLTTHIGRTNNPHSVTKSQVGLDLVTNKAEGNLSVLSATKLTNARTLAISGGVNGTATSFDGTGNVSIPVTSVDPSYLRDGYTKHQIYLDTHPENGKAIIPFINNDIAFLLRRGGSTSVYYDGVLRSIDVSSFYDGSPSYWRINPTRVTSIVIEITLHKTFNWTNTMYVAFGASAWGSTNITFDVMNTNNSETEWTNKSVVTGNTLGEYFFTFRHNNGTGFNKMRLTFSGWRTPKDFRIAQIGLLNYGSEGLKETYVSKGGSSLYGTLYPFTDSAYNLGTTANRWLNVYADNLIGALNGNASTASALATARTISLTGDVTGSVNTDFSSNPSITTTSRKIAFVGSNLANSNGWYKVAEQTMSGYGNTNITFMVTSTYSPYRYGILELQIRSDNTSISCKTFDWMTKKGFVNSDFIIVINGMKWSMYVYQRSLIHGRICFEILSMSNIDSKNMSWNLTFEDNLIKETIIPTPTVISTENSIVGYSNKLTTARTISLTGDVTGSVSFDGSANVSITSNVVDDSHNHVISNVDNLQTTLDSKLNSSAYNATDVLTKIKTVDGSGSGLDADTVDTYHVNNALNTGSLWTSDKILSTVESYGSHFDIVQYRGTYAVNDILTMTVPTITSNKSNGIEVLLYRNSAYESALLGIDYTYKYTSATQIQVQFFTAGTYIANYGFYNVGSWVLEWQ